MKLTLINNFLTTHNNKILVSLFLISLVFQLPIALVVSVGTMAVTLIMNEAGRNKLEKFCKDKELSCIRDEPEQAKKEITVYLDHSPDSSSVFWSDSVTLSVVLPPHGAKGYEYDTEYLGVKLNEFVKELKLERIPLKEKK